MVLASALNRNDQVPNQELAGEIVKANDKEAIKELIENLSNTKSIQQDCIKVLYEIGAQKPELIAGYSGEFILLLNSKNNRMQWGAMTALAGITKERPKEIYAALSKILTVAEKGSVITKDNAVQILIRLCAVAAYKKDAFPLLMEQLLKSPVNQLPMYAERSVVIIDEENKETFIKTLRSRLNDIDKPTKRKRVEKVMMKLTKG